MSNFEPPFSIHKIGFCQFFATFFNSNFVIFIYRHLSSFIDDAGLFLLFA